MQQTVFCLDLAAIDRNIGKLNSIARLHFGNIGARLVVIFQHGAIFIVIVDYERILAMVLRLVPNIAIHFDLCILIQANKARIREAVGSCWIIVVVLAARDVLGQLDWLEDKGLGGQLPLMLGHE